MIAGGQKLSLLDHPRVEASKTLALVGHACCADEIAENRQSASSSRKEESVDKKNVRDAPTHPPTQHPTSPPTTPTSSIQPERRRTENIRNLAWERTENVRNLA